MASEPSPDEQSRPAKPGEGFVLGCLTAPVICAAALGAWILTVVIARRGEPDPYWQIALVVFAVMCALSCILGGAAGAAVSKDTSLFKSAGMAALISFPFSIATGVFCGGPGGAPESFATFGMLVMFVGTFTGIVVAVVLRRRIQSAPEGRLQLRLNELLLVCLLLALGLICLGMEFRRLRADPWPVEDAPNSGPVNPAGRLEERT